MVSYWRQASGYQSESPTTSDVISQNQYIMETIFSSCLLAQGIFWIAFHH